MSVNIKVAGQDFVTLPNDLYIPPDAMLVMLDLFEGPFDLLLYLIKKNNLDILDIKVSKITKQYIEYIDLMQELKLELAADYLEMAATLTEIKSRMLLPRSKDVAEDEEDPRAALVRRLQEYEQIKKAANNLSDLPRVNKELFQVKAEAPVITVEKKQPEVDLKDLLLALQEVLTRTELSAAHNIERETLSVRAKMTFILARLTDDTFCDFVKLFNIEEGRLGVVVTFLAILEMVKEAILELVQSEPYAPIYVRVTNAN